MLPAQALAEEMLARGWRVNLSTDQRGARYAGGFPDAVQIELLNSATFARGGLAAKLMVPFRIALGALKAFIAMGRDRPAVVAGFGGYPAIPAMLAAGLRRTPRLIHEQNGVLGRVNRLFARRVQVIACGTWPTDLPSGAQGVFTGNPVRRAVLERAGAPYAVPDGHMIKIVVIGGSQGARILSRVVPAAIAALPENLRFRLSVVQQARPEDSAAVIDCYASENIEAEVSEFVDVSREFVQGQLVISRAGASSVADIAAIGRPAILIPYAAATGDHQTANARGLVDAGGAVLLSERDLDGPTLAKEIEAILAAPEHAATMAKASAAHGRPFAARDLANLVENLKDKR